MSATASSDFVFTPKVWQDHVRAYFRKKLVFGSVASQDDTLKPDAGKGETITYPFFKSMGPAEEPAENAGLAVDKLSDDSFSCTVKEVGKAVGIKKKAFKVSAARTATIIDEINRQIGRVHAEKVDADLLTEFSDNANSTVGYLATAAANTMNIRSLNQAKIVAFGDRADEAIVVFMHSLQFLDLLNDSTAGFLQANALDPMAMVDGFKGRLLGLAIVTNDQLPKVADIDGKDAYEAYIHKMNPYGIITKQDMEMESDYDILQREWVFTGNEWYGVKSFHGKVSSLDRRTARMTTTLSVADGV